MYDRAAFNKNYDLQFSENPPNSLAWYASLNIVICLGSMVAQSHSQFEVNETFEGYDNFVKEQQWKYFRNACSCFVDLMFKDYSLLAVQAICGMVRYYLCWARTVVTYLVVFCSTTLVRPAVRLYSNGSSWPVGVCDRPAPKHR